MRERSFTPLISSRTPPPAADFRLPEIITDDCVIHMPVVNKCEWLSTSRRVRISYFDRGRWNTGLVIRNRIKSN